MADSSSWGVLAPYKTAPLPPLISMFKALGPGVIFMALAQGSGELIWWPYIIAKYGLSFLFLLLPACLLQFPVTYEIGRYTVLTGESIFQGFIRLQRHFAFFLWILMTLSFLWFGAFAAAGGTSLAALTDFPAGWSARGQTLLGLCLDGGIPRGDFAQQGYLPARRGVHVGRGSAHIDWPALGKRQCRVAPCTAGFHKRAACAGSVDATPVGFSRCNQVAHRDYFRGPRRLLTLFYSYWVRDKGIGMAHYMGRLTGPITGKAEAIPSSGFVPGKDEGLAHVRRWRHYLFWDISIGIGGNLITTLMTCLLAYALLFPKGLLPQGYELAVVQSRFFEVSWGVIGRFLFLIVAAAFLSDTWLATVDAVSRIHTDCLFAFFPKAQSISVRSWYLIFLFVLTAITSATMGAAEPGPLILISAVIGFVGTVLFSVALIFLNHVYLPRHLPELARPGRLNLIFLCVSCLAYFLLAIAYLLTVAGIV